MYLKNVLAALPDWFEDNLTLIISLISIACLLVLFIIIIFTSKTLRKKSNKNINGQGNKSQDIKAEEIKEKPIGKYLITAPDKNGKYCFILKASNNQVIFKSRDYSSKAACKEGIGSFKSAVTDGVFTIEQDKSGRFQFRLQKGSQVYEGETVSRKDIAEKAVESIKNNSVSDKIIDENIAKK